MSRLLLIIIFICPLFLTAQTETKLILKGGVYASSNDAPVGYAGVHIRSTIIGAVTTEDGKFELSFEPQYLKDTLIFSSIGYKQV